MDKDTEIISNGTFTSKQAFDLCRAYARVEPRYEASNRHNGTDFLDFCQKVKLGLLYFHIALETINNPELSGYCLRGNVIDGGLDTAEKESTVCGSASKSEKKRRDKVV